MKCPICGKPMLRTHYCTCDENAPAKVSSLMEQIKAAEKRGAEQERERAKPLVDLLKRVWPIVRCRQIGGKQPCIKSKCGVSKVCLGGDIQAALKAYKEGNNA